MKTLPQVVIVEWIDSASHGDVWMPIAEADHRNHGGPLKCHTVGYLLHEDEEAITVASTWSPDTDGFPARCHSAMTIPAVAIVSMHPVSKDKSRR